MEKLKEENRLDGKFNILKFPVNTTKYYKIDKSQDWVRKMLIELNEKAEEKTPEEYFESTFLTMNIEITKKSKDPHGDYIVVLVDLQTEYVTQCVNTLEDTRQAFDLEFKACFLDSSFENDEIYQDQTEVFIEDDMHELYFFDRNFADLVEAFHEQIYLNINLYPTKEGSKPSDWANETSNTKQ